LLSQIVVINRVINLAKEVDWIAFLGDFFNGQGESLSKILYNVGFSLIKDLQATKPTFILVGNHDLYRNTNILQSFGELPNVTLIDETVDIRLESCLITLVPYGGRIPSSGNILFGHLGIEGVKSVTGGIIPGEVHPKELAGFEQVLLGHYHARQELGNIQYIGAVMQHSFSDIGNKCGVTIQNRDKFKFIEVISPTFNHIIIKSKEDVDAFMENRNSRNYYTLTVKDRKLELPSFDYRVVVEYDVEETVEGRLKQEKNETLETTIVNFIEKANTQVDKELAKKYITEILKEA